MIELKNVLMESTKSIIWGLEGCGKSSETFSIVKDIATVEKPILFGYKTYKLMYEQVESWSKRYNVPKEEFAIVGFNKEEDAPGLKYYTNKDIPYVISEKVRFVFIAQATLQRNTYKEVRRYVSDIYTEIVKFQHIIVDEFEFTIGLIPALDYLVNYNFKNINDLSQILNVELKKWILKNYTYSDYLKIMSRRVNKDSDYIRASWLDDENIRITFLTSEKLAVEILQAIGFKDIYNHGIDSMKDCTVNIYSSNIITKIFFQQMTFNNVWKHFKNYYDLIISDNISDPNNELIDSDIKDFILNHTVVKGSNSFINNRILTILSYIPQSVVVNIEKCFKSFGLDKSYKEIEELLYRDRLCQAIGRSLGYRGGKETDVITHKELYNLLINCDFPYTIVGCDLKDAIEQDFNNNKNIEIIDILKTIDIVEKELELLKDRRRSYYKNKIELRKEALLDYIELYFYKDPNSTLSVSFIKQYAKDRDLRSAYGRGYITASTIAEYFGLKVQVMKDVNGSSYRGIKGINYYTNI